MLRSAGGLRSSPADDAAAEGDGSVVDVVADLPADAQAAEPVQQRERAFHDPPVDTEATAVLGAAPGDVRDVIWNSGPAGNRPPFRPCGGASATRTGVTGDPAKLAAPTASIGQREPRGRGRRCLRTQARTQVSVPGVSRVSKHASTPSELAAPDVRSSFRSPGGRNRAGGGPGAGLGNARARRRHERLGGVRFLIGLGRVRLSNASTLEVPAFADRLRSEWAARSGFEESSLPRRLACESPHRASRTARDHVMLPSEKARRCVPFRTLASEPPDRSGSASRRRVSARRNRSPAAGRRQPRRGS